MHAPPDHWPGQPRYGARQEVHLDPVTRAKLKGFVTAFRRSRSEVLGHLLQWGLDHGRAPAPAHCVFLRIVPELRQQERQLMEEGGSGILAPPGPQ
jgi:hypothetical protein